MAQLLEEQISFPMLGYFRSQHSNQSWLTALVAIVDYATIVSLTSQGSLLLQANLTAALGRHVLADVVVIFGLEDSCKNRPLSRLSSKAEELRGILRRRPSLFEASKLSGSALEEGIADYEPQAAALGAYFLMSLPAAVPDKAVTNNWSVGISDRDEAPFAVSDPFKDKP
jgi:hypothetical protein